MCSLIRKLTRGESRPGRHPSVPALAAKSLQPFPTYFHTKGWVFPRTDKSSEQSIQSQPPRSRSGLPIKQEESPLQVWRSGRVWGKCLLRADYLVLTKSQNLSLGLRLSLRIRRTRKRIQSRISSTVASVLTDKLGVDNVLVSQGYRGRQGQDRKGIKVDGQSSWHVGTRSKNIKT